MTPGGSPGHVDAARYRALAHAEELLAAERPADALRSLSPVVASDPDDRDAVRLTALALFGTGDWRESARLSAALLASDPRDVEIEMLLVRCRSRSGDRYGASRDAEALLQRHPGAVEPLILLADVAATRSSAETPRRAVTAARRAVELAPDNPRTHRALGHALLRRRQNGKARRAFEQVLRLDPHDQAARMLHAQLNSLGPVEIARELAGLVAGSPHRASLIDAAAAQLAYFLYVWSLVVLFGASLAAWLLADGTLVVARSIAAILAIVVPAASIALVLRRLGRHSRPLAREVAARFPGTIVGAVIVAASSAFWIVAAANPGSGAHWYRVAIVVAILGSTVVFVAALVSTALHARRSSRGLPRARD